MLEVTKVTYGQDSSADSESLNGNMKNQELFYENIGATVSPEIAATDIHEEAHSRSPCWVC